MLDESALSLQLLRSLSDGIVVLGLDARIRYANPSAASLLGAGDLAGRSVDDFLDAAGRGHAAGFLAEAAQGRFLEGEVDTMLVRADGQALWVRLRQTPFVEDDRVTGLVLRLTDNHETKGLLEAAHASHRALVRAERIGRSGSWTWDVVRGQVTASEGLEELYGDHMPALLGQDRGRLVEMTHPDDRHRVVQALDGLLDGSAPRVDVELRQLGRHGWMWVRLRAVATYDAAGVLREASGTYQDITRARATEDRLQDLVTQTSLMQSVATAANTAASLDEILEQAGALVVLHDDWDRARAFVPTPDGSGVVPHALGREAYTDGDAEIEAIEAATAAASYRTGRSVWDPERRLTLACPVRLDGEILAVVVITSLPPLHRHDMIQQMVEDAATVLGQVAGRERSERELAAARDRAVEASRHKSEFLATMSHEIRTPLNGIIGLNELLDATTLSERQRLYVTGISVSSRTLLDLINDILDFSKIEAGRFEVETVDLSVREVLDDVANLLAETARHRGVDLQVSCSPEVPEVLAGDPTRLRQVLLNLGSNALKFTHEGAVAVRATVEDDGRGGPAVLRFEVRDTGIGIPAEHLERIFTPFSQADSSTTRHYGGSGLGLAICAEIVTALGGQIGVDSTPGVGSTFWFTTRLGTASGTTRDDAHARAREVLGSLRVLVVDDHEQNRLILREQLGWWGVASTEVADGPAALAAVAAARREGRPYDAVLLDLAMPGRDGLSVAAALRHGDDASAVPIMLLSSSHPPSEDALRAAGIAAHLVKPVPSSTLRDALLALLARPAPDEAEVAAPAADGRRGTVLVVEDNEINQVVARGFLEAAGFTVETADDGRDALDLIARRGYDAVLMDLQMPRLDGFETTRAVRRDEARVGAARRLPIIAVTATAVAGERERCLAAGMDDFVTKPLSPSALAEVLDRWTGDGGTTTTASTASTGDGAAVAAAGPAGPSGPHLDLDRLGLLLDLDPGDTSYLDRAIGRFLDAGAEFGTLVATAVASADAPALDAAAHALKGNAANLGLPVVAGVAGELEDLARTGTTSGAGPLVQRLEVALDEAAVAVAGYRDWYRARSAVGDG